MRSTIPQTYDRAVAFLDLLAQRQVAFAQLRQKGVLVLDAPPDCIRNQLVDRYLQYDSQKSTLKKKFGYDSVSQMDLGDRDRLNPPL